MSVVISVFITLGVFIVFGAILEAMRIHRIDPVGDLGRWLAGLLPDPGPEPDALPEGGA